MGDEGGKVVSLRVAEHRRDWGEGTIPEMTGVLNEALDNGERIMIFVFRRDPNGNHVVSSSGYTRHNSKISWPELLTLLQAKMYQWYAVFFQ